MQGKIPPNLCDSVVPNHTKTTLMMNIGLESGHILMEILQRERHTTQENQESP